MRKLFCLLRDELFAATFMVVVDDDHNIFELKRRIREGWKSDLGDADLSDIDLFKVSRNRCRRENPAISVVDTICEVFPTQITKTFA